MVEKKFPNLFIDWDKWYDEDSEPEDESDLGMPNMQGMPNIEEIMKMQNMSGMEGLPNFSDINEIDGEPNNECSDIECESCNDNSDLKCSVNKCELLEEAAGEGINNEDIDSQNEQNSPG